MRDINKSIKLWLDEMEQYELAKYERLPDIDLYMDQMMTYLERHLEPFAISTLDKQITPSMINNYVKSDTIPNPTSKRYNKEHIALIFEICLLKKALNISDIKQIIDTTYLNTDFKETYNDFANKSDLKLHSICKEANQKLENIDTNDHAQLINLALDLSLSANVYVSVAKRILHYIQIQNDLKE